MFALKWDVIRQSYVSSKIRQRKLLLNLFYPRWCNRKDTELNKRQKCRECWVVSGTIVRNQEIRQKSADFLCSYVLLYNVWVCLCSAMFSNFHQWSPIFTNVLVFRNIESSLMMYTNVQVVTDSSSDSPLLRSSGRSSRPRTVYLDKVIIVTIGSLIFLNLKRGKDRLPVESKFG